VEYRRVGKSGLVVSVVGLGCNNFGKTLDLGATRAVCQAALEEGVTLFNVGDTYGRPAGSTTAAAEAYLGEVLTGHRDEVIISTKFGNDMFGANGSDWGARGSRRYIRRAVDSSLRQLRTDWIDLYELHNLDALTPIEETLSALTDLVREGKVRYVGVSNVPAWRLVHAEWVARERGLERFVSVEVEYSLLSRDAEREVIPACAEFGIGLLPYYPLAHGVLTGKYGLDGQVPLGSRLDTWAMSDYLSAERLQAVRRVKEFALERGLSAVDVAIGALAANPVVSSVVAGATRPEQVRANAAATRWLPDEEELKVLRELLQSGTEYVRNHR
jgi:aryl-alcohol dehydrogenase-like predicted oxidoreductase